MLITALAITAAIVLAAVWLMIRAWPLESARLWSVAWSIMAGCTVMALWMAQYWRGIAETCCRESATTQWRARPMHQPQSPRLQFGDFPCDAVPLHNQPSTFALPLSDHPLAFRGAFRGDPFQRAMQTNHEAADMYLFDIQGVHRSSVRSLAGKPLTQNSAYEGDLKSHTQTAATPHSD
jgi:hypothetical protein